MKKLGRTTEFFLGKKDYLFFFFAALRFLGAALRFALRAGLRFAALRFFIGIVLPPFFKRMCAICAKNFAKSLRAFLHDKH